MLKKAKLITSSVLSLVTLFVGTKVMAVNLTPDTGYTTSNLPGTVSIIISALLGIAALISVIYIIVGGFSYITSSGNAEKVQSATKTITYAIIGLIVIALAFAIKTYALQLLGLGTINPSL